MKNLLNIEFFNEILINPLKVLKKNILLAFLNINLPTVLLIAYEL